MSAIGLIDDELYQMLTQRAALDENWAAYFLLVNTCHKIVKEIPQTQMACDTADIELLLIRAIERLGEAIMEILPGGAEEFAGYMPQPEERSPENQTVVLEKQ